MTRSPVPRGSARPHGSRIRWLLLAVAWCLAGLTAAGGAHAGQTLTILHSSEHHGAALPLEERLGRGETRLIGGMAARAGLIKAIRQEAAAVLLVDSGDILIGTPLSSFFRGEPDIKAMNLMGYQAMAAGNHDFDFGLAHLARLRNLASFPILCSNVVGKHTALPCQPTAVVKAGALSVGLLGLLGQSNFPATFNREVVDHLDFLPPIETARTLARNLKAEGGVDLVVAVTHQGTEEDLALLDQAPEVDVIIGGHTEGFDGIRAAGRQDPVPELIAPGRIFVKTHRQGKTLGRLDLVLTREQGKPGLAVAEARATNLPVTVTIPPEPGVQSLLDGYAHQLEAQAGTVIGEALVDLEGESGLIRSQETNLGSLLADLLRAEFGTDVALVNGGQIRDSIPAGPVPMKRVLQVLPFDSQMVTFAVTGAELLQALEHSVGALPRKAGRFLQVSGLTVTYALSAPPGSRVQAVLVHGRPVEPARRYSVATDVFLAEGGDGYTLFARATDRLDRQIPLRDILLKALRTGPLKAAADGRIRFVDSSSAARPSTDGATIPLTAHYPTER